MEFKDGLELIKDKKNGILECSWQEMVEKLELEVHKDTLRKSLAVGKYSGYNIIDYYENLLQQKHTDVDKIQELQDVKRQLEIMKVQYQDERRVNSKYMRPLARHERLRETLRKCLNNWEPLEIKETEVNLNAHREASLLCSDWHLGIECNNYWNVFNTKIAEERVNRLFGYAKQYCKMFEIKTLYIEFLGDIISGYIHKTIELENEIDVVEQIRFAINLISTHINDIANTSISQVKVYMTVGNHGRMNPNKKESVDKENFEYLIWDGVKERVKHPKVEFVENTIDETFISYEVNGELVIGVHGHLDSVKSVIGDFAKMFQKPIKEIHMGHLHHSMSDEESDIKLVMNSNLSGVDSHAKKGRYFGSPSQTLMIYDGDNTLNFNIAL